MIVGEETRAHFLLYHKVSLTMPVSNLSFLRTLSSGDSIFIADIIDTFLEITPSALEGIHAAAQAKNYAEVRRITHSLKANLKMLGIDTAYAAALRLEQNSEAHSEADEAEVAKELSILQENCELAFGELREVLKTL